LTPGSGIWDPEWVYSRSRISEICGYKKMFDKKKFLTTLFAGVFRSGIREPGWVKIRIRDPG
jgi:hypothetical protein